MHRLLYCLPLCLLLAPGGADRLPDPANEPKNAAVEDKGDALPSASEMEKLAQTNVIGFVENCLRRYQREIKGYKGVLQKQERVAGTLGQVEVIDAAFREKPHSVLMIWQKGAGLAERSLYVEGQNDDKLLARPAGAIARFAVGDVVRRDVDGADAKSTSRYTMAQFGMKKAAERVLSSLREGKESGDYTVEYLGIQKLKEVGDRPCYTFRRTFDKIDAEGLKEAVISYDVENWLQVGTLLKLANGDLLASYFFRDLVLNPDFKSDQFTEAALKP